MKEKNRYAIFEDVVSPGTREFIVMGTSKTTLAEEFVSSILKQEQGLQFTYRSESIGKEITRVIATKRAP